MTVPLLIQSQLAGFVFHYLRNDLFASKALAAGTERVASCTRRLSDRYKRQSINSNSTPQLRSYEAQSQKAEGQL